MGVNKEINNKMLWLVDGEKICSGGGTSMTEAPPVSFLSLLPLPLIHITMVLPFHDTVRKQEAKQGTYSREKNHHQTEASIVESMGITSSSTVRIGRMGRICHSYLPHTHVGGEGGSKL